MTTNEPEKLKVDAGNRGCKDCLGCLLLIFFVAVFFAFIISNGGSDGSTTKDAAAPQTTAGTTVPIPTYEVVATEDVSIAAAKRYTLRVVIPDEVTQDQIRLVGDTLIAQQKREHKFNALSISFYKNKEESNEAYTRGQVDYAPNGDWSQASKVDAGDYSTHQANYSFN